MKERQIEGKSFRVWTPVQDHFEKVIDYMKENQGPWRLVVDTEKTFVTPSADEVLLLFERAGLSPQVEKKVIEKEKTSILEFLGVKKKIAVFKATCALETEKEANLEPFVDGRCSFMLFHQGPVHSVLVDFYFDQILIEGGKDSSC